MRFKSLAVLSVAVAWTALADSAEAQTTGAVRGTLKDMTGAVIAHAAVVIVNAATQTQRDTTSDDQGAYTFTLLPVGAYDLEITFPGFVPYRRNGVVIDVDSVVQIDATLQIAAQTERVTVTEAAVHVETAQTALGETIGAEHVAAVPRRSSANSTMPGCRPFRRTTSATALSEAFAMRSPSIVCSDRIA